MMYPSEIPMRKKIIDEILEKKIVAVVSAANEDQARKITQALYDGGITLVAYSFDLICPESYDKTAKWIRAFSREFKDMVYPGGANIISKELLYAAMNDMGQFIISPDADVEVIQQTRRMGLVSLAGAATPTEAKAAYAAGADFVTIFPCMSDTPAYLKAISGVLRNIRFLATCGADNAVDMIQAGAVGVCIDNGLVNKAWVDASEYWRITEKAKELVAKLG